MQLDYGRPNKQGRYNGRDFVNPMSL